MKSTKAGMIYRLLKFLFYFAVKGYFKIIRVRNLERIPKNGPIIFVANHTSAFMDPILLALHIERELFFLARGEAFNNKIASKILTSLNLIPVFRPEVSPDKVYKNEQIFSKCHEHLSQGNCLLIFPEGFSKTERRLRKLKTGTARIALGAEANHDFKLALKIIPIGINYTNPHHFRSEVFLNIGHPIEVKSYKKSYQKNQFEAARKLTDHIREELKERTISIQNEELDDLIFKIERVYEDEYKEQFSSELTKGSDKFLLSKEIVKVVSHFYRTDRPRVLHFKKMIDGYFRHMDLLKLRDSQVQSTGTRQNLFGYYLLLILCFPLFLYGYINNIIPYKLTSYLAFRMTKREDFHGSMKLALGLLIFLIFYILQTVILSIFFSLPVPFIYFLSLYPAGLFTLFYLQWLFRTLNRIHGRKWFVKKKAFMQKIVKQRNDIISALEAGRDDFAKSQYSE